MLFSFGTSSELRRLDMKLELSWIGKGEEPALEPRILILEPEYSFGDVDTGNLLIHGDNLLALKALEQDYAGKVKCIYIDPPYNTGNAFEHYDDGIEHSLWLNLMYHRLVLLKNLLNTEGSIWISIDDDESHYLKVMCDEIFGRKNFVANVIWQKKYSPQNDAKWLSDSHDHILVYAKNKEIWRPNLLPRGEKQNAYYKYDDNDGRGLWRSDNVLVKSFSQSGVFAIVNPNTGKEYYPPKGSCYRFNAETAKRFLEENRFYFGKEGTGAPQLKRFLSEVKDGVTSLTIWLREEVGDNQEAKKEVKDFNGENIFSTPKPERLIERILFLATQPGDLVLDSFLGSGTTAAVAHKMGRRWIGIELGNHAYTHCVPRLKKVVTGEDQGGISKAMNWTGGGGFKTCRLAHSLLEKDDNGMLRFNPDFTDDMIAEAVAKIEGFIYLPPSVKGDENARPFWQQAQSTEKDFLFVTKVFVTRAWLGLLAEQVPHNVSLLICCPAYGEGCERAYKHINLKKIPHSFMHRFEFDEDDYSLKVENVLSGVELVPHDNDNDNDNDNAEQVPRYKDKKKNKKLDIQQELF